MDTRETEPREMSEPGIAKELIPAQGLDREAERKGKSSCLLMMSLLLLPASLITAWYTDHLVNRLFVFFFPIHAALFVCFVVLLVKSIRRIFREKDVSACFSALVLALLAALIVFFPFRDARVKYEVNRYEADRLEIIRMIRDDQLRPRDRIGNVDLPAGYTHLSSDGEVFVYQNDPHGQVISFWVFRGLLSGSAELVYSTGGEELIRASGPGHPIRRIDKLKENWYYVQTDY